MNGIENITGRILAEAREQRSLILARAQHEASNILHNFEEFAKAETDKILSAGKDEAREHELRLNGVAQLEARKMRLKTKQEMLDTVFDTALAGLLALPEAEYIKTLAYLAQSGALTGSEEIILTAADREKYGERVVEAANAAIKEAGCLSEASLRLSAETREIMGGLILKDGDIEVNAAFETIIRILREELSYNVAELLFS